MVVVMKIGLLIYPSCVVSGLFAFAELLAVANKRAGKPIFTTHWLGVDDKDVAITTGSKTPVMTMKVEDSFLNTSIDALLIPGFWTNHSRHVERAIDAYQPLVSALKHLPVTTHVWGYCTAVCMMAASGRIDHQQATATWWLADFVENKYPAVNWRFSQTYIHEAQHRTASGLNGYLPIAQALIDEHCGQDILRDIIELMLIPKPEKSAQPFRQIKLMKLDDKFLREIYIWVEKTPATAMTIPTLAQHLNQTERTIARKVKQATDLSIASFMRLIKLHQASELLIYSRKPINLISDALGFSDDAAFRRTFKKVSTYTPSEYRQAFQR
jgi:transcriptional regulator GlxA family with amidase domain